MAWPVRRSTTEIRKRTPVPVSGEGVVVLLCGVGLVGGNGSANKLPNLESSYGK